MFVRKSLPDTPVVLHRYTVEKHGSHNQASHGRKGGRGSSGGGGGGGGSKQSSYDRKLGEVRDDKRVSAAVADLDKLSKDIDKERAKVKNGPAMVERDDYTRPKAKVLAALDTAQKKIDGDKEKLVAAVKTTSNKEHYQLLQRVGHSESSYDAVRRGLGEKVAENYMKISDDSLFEYTESLKEAVSLSTGGSRMEG